MERGLQTPGAIQNRYLNLADRVAQQAFRFGFEEESVFSHVDNKPVPGIRHVPDATLMHRVGQEPSVYHGSAYWGNHEFPFLAGVEEWTIKAKPERYTSPIIYFIATFWQPWDDQPKLWLYHDIRLDSPDLPEHYGALSITHPQFSEITQRHNIGVQDKHIAMTTALQTAFEQELKGLKARPTMVIKPFNYEWGSWDGLSHKGYELDLRNI